MVRSRFRPSHFRRVTRPMSLHPIRALDRVIAEYRDYLRTEFRAKDLELRAALERELDAPMIPRPGAVLSGSPSLQAGKALVRAADRPEARLGHGSPNQTEAGLFAPVGSHRGASRSPAPLNRHDNRDRPPPRSICAGIAEPTTCASSVSSTMGRRHFDRVRSRPTVPNGWFTSPIASRARP